MNTNLCSKCQEPHNRGGQRYCFKCHAEFNRAWRKVAFRRKLARLARTTGDRRFAAAVEAYDALTSTRGGKRD